MYFIQSGDVQIAGASPETMVRLTNGKLVTFPVAGTRKRGRTPEEDRALEQELLADEKELAEHNMLVDLARNDIGKISEYGTVQVEDYMSVHRFSRVMHIASVVTGTLKEGKDACDAVSGAAAGGNPVGGAQVQGLRDHRRAGAYGKGRIRRRHRISGLFRQSGCVHRHPDGSQKGRKGLCAGGCGNCGRQRSGEGI